MKHAEPERLSALLTLLQDDDVRIASLAMEQFLKMDGVTDATIAEHQESHDPHLRQRIHQLSTILTRRRARQSFIEALSQEQITLWEGVQQINMLYDPQCDLKQVDDAVSSLFKRLASQPVTTPRIAELMREQEFNVPEEDTLDVDLYLVQRVLETRYGSAAVLAALAHLIGGKLGWAFTIVLHGGRFCLIDRNNLLLDPNEGWHISKLKTDSRIHPCTRMDVLMGILGQLFLVALIGGHLRDLYHFGDLLTALNGGTIDALPFPLGASSR